jgi:glycosyltransferase involved in cell wall biosynthesis
VKVLLWHVHGSWTTSFVQGAHDYLLPVDAARDADGRGRAETWTWPDSAREVAVEDLGDADVDLVVLQRPRELDLLHRWTGRVAGRTVPAVYVEHNTPSGHVPFTRHPLADNDRIPIVHVTHFNRLMWDCGTARTEVVEHGVVDPGARYTGELERAAVMINEPVRRGRAVGTDVVLRVARDVPVDLFGIGAERLDSVSGLDADRLRTVESLPQDQLHDELSRHRVYVHTSRWTSLGLSLIEAMQLGMPVVALATTEAHRAVVPGTGVLTSDVEELVAATRHLLAHPDEARRLGSSARTAALERFGLKRFLDDWDVVLERYAG